MSVELWSQQYPALWLGGLFVLGLLVGSFLNVVGLRLLQEESFVTPPSHCPHCKTPLRPWENIPVLSYLLLGGQCRACKAGISIQYPLIEILTALLFAGLGWQFGATWATLLYLFLAANLVVILITDWRESLIFHVNSWPLIPVGFLMSLLGLGPADWTSSLLGMAAAFVFFEGLILLSQKLLHTEGFGHGDTHLMMGIGAYLGWQPMAVALFLGFGLQAVLAIPMLVWQWMKEGQYKTLGSACAGVVFGLCPILVRMLPLDAVFQTLLVLLFAGLTLWALWTFLKQVRHRGTYTYMPLGPALVLASLGVLFALPWL
jgi:prepilin signal peptidase PulO-like enzyme (type II secretory pathway)